MVRVSSSATRQRLRQLAEERGITNAEATNLLLDFYELKRLDLLITALRKKAQSGLKAEELAQLSVLLTFLQARLPFQS